MSNRRSAVFLLVIFSLVIGGNFVHYSASIIAVVLSVYVAISVLRTERRPREQKEENPPISRVSSGEIMATLRVRRRALNQKLARLRELQAETVREIDNLSIEMGIDHHGISPELAQKLSERAELRNNIISVVGDIQRLDKHIEATRVLISKARRD